jgi:hypothetical protein
MADVYKNQGDRKPGDMSREQQGGDKDRNRTGQNPGSSQQGNPVPARDDEDDQMGRQDKNRPGSQEQPNRTER